MAGIKHRGRRINDRVVLSALQVAVLKLKDEMGVDALLDSIAATYSSCDDDTILAIMKTVNLGLSDLPERDDAEPEDTWLFKSGVFDRFLTNYNSPSPQYINILYFYVKYRHSHLLESDVEMGKINEPLVSALRDTFHRNQAWDQHAADEFHGRYQVYRPCYMSPKDTLLLGELVLGSGDPRRPFEASLTYIYERKGVERNEVVTGKVTPHHDRLTIVLTNDHKDNFFLYIDHITPAGLADEIRGIMIVDAGRSDPAGAWPFVAQRLAEGETPKVGRISAAEIDDDIAFNTGRGFVDWMHSRYPGWANRRKPGS